MNRNMQVNSSQRKWDSERGGYRVPSWVEVRWLDLALMEELMGIPTRSPPQPEELAEELSRRDSTDLWPSRGEGVWEQQQVKNKELFSLKCQDIAALFGIPSKKKIPMEENSPSHYHHLMAKLHPALAGQAALGSGPTPEGVAVPWKCKLGINKCNSPPGGPGNTLWWTLLTCDVFSGQTQ